MTVAKTVALETRELEKHFGGLKVTRNLSLKVEQGARTCCYAESEKSWKFARKTPSW